MQVTGRDHLPASPTNEARALESVPNSVAVSPCELSSRRCTYSDSYREGTLAPATLHSAPGSLWQFPQRQPGRSASGNLSKCSDSEGGKNFGQSLLQVHHCNVTKPLGSDSNIFHLCWKAGSNPDIHIACQYPLKPWLASMFENEFGCLDRCASQWIVGLQARMSIAYISAILADKYRSASALQKYSCGIKTPWILCYTIIVLYLFLP